MILNSVLWAAALTAPADVPADVAEVEKAVLDYRRAIHSGHMGLRQSTFLNGGRTPDRERTTTVWFDGKQVRNDVLLRYPKESKSHKEVYCRNCEFKDYYVDYNSYSEEDVHPSAHLEPLGAFNDPDRQAALDPRLLGMVVDNAPCLGLSRSHLDSYIGAPNREGVTMEKGLWNGVESFIISWRRPAPSNLSVRAWVVPSWGPSVARIETSGVFTAEGPYKGLDFGDSVESEYKQVGAAAVWFPQSVVYERRRGGKAYEKEEARVEVFSLNDPLPQEVFKMAGMDIPPKTPVVGYRKEGLSYWDGKSIVPQDPPPPLLVVPSAGFGSISDNWPYVVSAVFFALLGAGTILLYLRQQKPRPGAAK